jgi:hypothetical protein
MTDSLQYPQYLSTIEIYRNVNTNRDIQITNKDTSVFPHAIKIPHDVDLNTITNFTISINEYSRVLSIDVPFVLIYYLGKKITDVEKKTTTITIHQSLFFKKLSKYGIPCVALEKYQLYVNLQSTTHFRYNIILLCTKMHNKIKHDLMDNKIEYLYNQIETVDVKYSSLYIEGYLSGLFIQTNKLPISIRLSSRGQEYLYYNEDQIKYACKYLQGYNSDICIKFLRKLLRMYGLDTYTCNDIFTYVKIESMYLFWFPISFGVDWNDETLNECITVTENNYTRLEINKDFNGNIYLYCHKQMTINNNNILLDKIQ